MTDGKYTFSPSPGVLYFVGTPIGNLADITQRALACLRAVDLIACEDTRHARKLLRQYHIEKPLLSLYAQNESKRSEQLVDKLEKGNSIAVITDAGMPGISDPGYRLIQHCRKNELAYEIIPGPSAVLTALLGSGLPTDSFYFGGFLPTKKGKREKVLHQALQKKETAIFFESPHRLLSTLEMLAELDREREICIAREMTKKFEEYQRGKVIDIYTYYTKKGVKGEAVVVIAGRGLKGNS